MCNRIFFKHTVGRLKFLGGKYVLFDLQFAGLLDKILAIYHFVLLVCGRPEICIGNTWRVHCPKTNVNEYYSLFSVLLWILSGSGLVIGDNLWLIIPWFPQCHDWWDSVSPRYFSISIAFSLPAKFSSGYSQVFQNRSLNVAAHHPKPAVSQSSGCFSLILQILSPGLMWPLTRGWWHSASDFFCVSLIIRGQNLLCSRIEEFGETLDCKSDW